MLVLGRVSQDCLTYCCSPHLVTADAEKDVVELVGVVDHVGSGPKENKARNLKKAKTNSLYVPLSWMVDHEILMVFYYN